MKRFNLTAFGLLFLAFTMAGCGKDEPAAPQEPEENPLIGHWQIKAINFTTFVSAGFPANDVTVLSGMAGYTFEEDGNFVFESNTTFGAPGAKYWDWTGDEKGFVITQKNKSMPPYDFGITPKNLKVEKVNNVLTMTFSADLANSSKADFTLEKVEHVNLDAAPAVTGADALVIGHWQLKTIDFTTYVATGRPASDAKMLSGMAGYTFEEGGNFIFESNTTFGAPGTKYWDWEGDPVSFQVIQKNKSMPPYNFGFTPENLTIKETEDGLVMTFSADLANGSTADFMLEKVDEIDLEATPVVTGDE